MVTQIKKVTKSKLNIVWESDLQGLDEVDVIYGKVTKKELTVAVSQVLTIDDIASGSKFDLKIDTADNVGVSGE